MTTMYTLWMVLVNIAAPGGVASEKQYDEKVYTLQQCNEKQSNMGIRRPADNVVVIYECRPVEII